MSFSYYNIKKHPRNFRNITGLTIEEFENPSYGLKTNKKGAEDRKKG